jgi:hypothetical protein
MGATQMKKHIIAGSTGLSRIRSLVEFRHHNPVARFVSILLAFAIAMLLVIAPSAAFGDDSAPTAPTTDAAAPVDPTVTDTPPADTSTAPADTSAPSSTSGPATDPTVSPASKTPKETSSASVANASQVTPALVVTPTCVAGQGTVVPLVGGFEIDGDLCPEGALDWNSPGVTTPTAGAKVEDGFGADDHSVFTEGSSEGDNPADWTVKDSAPNGKTDIGTAWAFSQVVNNTVYGYFALTNDSTSGGTSQYDVEYNRAHNVTNGNGALVPNRTPADPANEIRGDLLFRFSSTGSDPIVFTDAKEYKNLTDSSWDAKTCELITTAAGWCTIPNPTTAFTQQVTSDGMFFEAAINISLILGGPGTCSPVFGAVNIRSVTGNSFYESSLKDYVAPLDVQTPSNCGSLAIEKVDENGSPLPGATFTISADPRPGHTGAVTVRDGATLPSAAPGTTAIADPDGVADGDITFSEANPNISYTVTEVSPPSSLYMIDNPLGTSTNPQTTSSGHPATFHFVDHRIWKGLTAIKSANPT